MSRKFSRQRDEAAGVALAGVVYGVLFLAALAVAAATGTSQAEGSGTAFAYTLDPGDVAILACHGGHVEVQAKSEEVVVTCVGKLPEVTAPPAPTATPTKPAVLGRPSWRSPTRTATPSGAS